MNLLINTIVMTIALCLCLATTAQEHNDHENHAAYDAHVHHDHDQEEAGSGHNTRDAHNTTAGPTLARTEDIESAQAKGGEPTVADVLGVVCDFCALAMNKIFVKKRGSRRDLCGP